MFYWDPAGHFGVLLGQSCRNFDLVLKIAGSLHFSKFGVDSKNLTVARRDSSAFLDRFVRDI